MPSYAWFLVLSVVIWASIVAVWVRWIRGRMRRRDRLRTWSRLWAPVVEARSTRETVSIDNSTQHYTVFHARYEFTDPQGVTHRGEHRSREVMREGDLLEVVHDPGEPSTHEPVALTGPTWATVSLMVIITLGVALFGVITLFLGLGYD